MAKKRRIAGKATGCSVGAIPPQEVFRIALPRLDALALVLRKGDAAPEEATEFHKLYDAASEGWAMSLADGSCLADGPESDIMASAGNLLFDALMGAPLHGRSQSVDSPRSVVMDARDRASGTMIRLAWKGTSDLAARSIIEPLTQALASAGFDVMGWEVAKPPEAG